jgi:hypothetical protein
MFPIDETVLPEGRMDCETVAGSVLRKHRKAAEAEMRSQE